MRDGLRLPGAALFFFLAGLVGCAAGGSGGLVGAAGGPGGSGTTSSTGSTLTGATSSSTSASTSSSTSASTSSSTSASTSTGTGGSGAGGSGTGGSGTGGGGPPPGNPLGADCTMDSDCASMLCKPVVIDSNPVCVTPCTQQSDCGTTGTYFCEPITAGSTNGYCIPQSPAHCLSCTQDSDCGSLSEVCAQASGDNAMACHIDCSIAGAAACPPDYSCTAEMVNGQSRQLCAPKSVPTCLDAVGGFCDRLSIPQTCARMNSAGNCVGERTCMTGNQRFSACDATAPQCKTDCSVQNPAGCMESFCTSATGTVTNCGMCGTTCPGVGAPNDNVTCNTSQTCTFSCQGENYDVNGDPSDGCEVADSPQGNHTETSAAYEGDVACYDGNGHTVHFTGQLPSDKRAHQSPAITGFDATSGSAPDWYYINATGQSSVFNPCVDDVVLTFSVQGSSSPSCYKMVVITDKNTYSCQTDATGNCSINQSSSQYTDGSIIDIEISKTCPASSLIENVSYTVDGHI